MTKQIPGAFLCALTLALAAPSRAEDPPALELTPLLPPKAPWLKKSSKKQTAPGTQAKKTRRKKGATEQLDVQPGAPFVAAPPLALPALPLPEPSRPPAVARPPPTAAVAQPPPLALPPLIEAPSAPPILVSSVGVFLKADGLDAATAARVEEGLRGVVKVAPLLRLGPVLARPAKPCADDACLSAQAAVQAMDQLVVATYAAGGLRVRLLDVGGKKTLSEAAQEAVGSEQLTASAEALLCKLLVPAGCSGEVAVESAAGVRLELDGKPLLSGEKRKVAVGLHQITARAGGKVAQRSLPVAREGAPALVVRLVDGEPQILAPGELPTVARPLPREAVAVSSAEAPAHWNRPVGLAALGIGVAVAAAGTYFGVKSHSDLNQAESSFRANGGAYRTGDVATLHSGNSAAHSANTLFIASGVLLAAGAVLTWAF